MERNRQPLLCRNRPSERRVLTRDAGPQRFQEQHIRFLVHAQKATIFVLIVCLKIIQIHVVKFILISPIVHKVTLNKNQLFMLVSNL